MIRFLTKVMVVAAVFVSLFAIPMKAGGIETVDQIRTKLNNALQNTGNAGNEFYLSFPPCYEVSGNNRLCLYIACPVRTKVRVEVEGRGFVAEQFTRPYDCIEFVLAPGVAQAYSKSANDGAPAEQVYTQQAVRIRAGAPIVVYGVTRFDFTSDSFLALPVQAFGREYIVSSMADMSWMYGGLSLPSETCVVAAYDNTNVTFTLGGNAVTRTSGGMRTGQTKTWTLNRGDVLVLANAGDSKEGDMSGSKVIASKPVGVVSGNQCANVPTSIRWCDFISEMELPTNTWGKNYHIPRFDLRTNSYMMKVFASQPNTKLFRNGSYWRQITTAGGVEGSGYIYERSDASGNNVVTLSADKPINCTVFNPGQEDDNISTDPYQMVIYPVEQYQKEIIFCTPGIRGGRGFARNYLHVVYEMTASNTVPDDLEFGTSVNGKINWQKFTAVFGAQTGRIFPGKINGKTYAHKFVTLPGDNVYRMRCSKPFAAYSSGGSDYDSYGHPTSAALAVLTGDTMAPIPRYVIECDGSVGYTKEATVTDTVNADAEKIANLGMVYLNSESKNYEIEVKDFVAGESIGTTWKLRVVNPDTDAVAIVHFIDRALNEKVDTIRYQARRISIVPSDLNFGLVRKGETKTGSLQVKNEGTSEITVSRLELKGLAQAKGKFVILNNPIPFKLQPNETKDVTIQFTGDEEGDFKDSIGVGDDCIFRYRRLVLATVGEPIINTSKVVNFGTQVVNVKSDAKIFTVFSEGTVKLTLSGMTGPTPQENVFTFDQADADFFTQLSGTNTYILNARGVTGGNGDKRQFNVYFTPTAEKDYTAKLTFSSDANRIDSVIELNGKGVKAGLTANIVEYGRRRMAADGSKRYATDVANVVAEVILSNSGSSQVTISDVKPISANAAKFNVDINAMKITIPAGEKRTFPISYIPTATSHDTLKLEFINTSTDTPVFMATGTGILPRITFPDVDFGTVVSGSNRANTKDFVITNEQYEFSDEVTITDLKMDTPGEVDETGQPNFGSEGFTYNKAAITFPIKILPGANYSFNRATNADAAFYAQYRLNPPTFSAKITTVTDGVEAEKTSTWTGKSIANKVEWSVTDAQNSTCVASAALMQVVFKNESSQNVPITALSVQPFSGPQSTYYTMLTTQAEIDAALPLRDGQSFTFRIQYRPTAVGAGHRADLGFIVNGSPNIDGMVPGNPNQVKNVAAFTGTANQYTTSLGVQNAVVDATTSDKVNIRVFNQNNNLDNANLKSAKFRVEWTQNPNERVIAPIRDAGNKLKVTIPAQSPMVGWTVTTDQIGDNFVELTLTG
ncbi:MAG: choice-of-anchor D domain-containing protein, partial [Candidatus Kapabacteria bacterium]|nr:choice-of-anchor D domain-containing protein [Candidatus Kapabacteria bacterium]